MTAFYGKGSLFVVVMDVAKRDIDVLYSRGEAASVNNIGGTLVIFEDGGWLLLWESKVSEEISECENLLESSKERACLGICC